MWIQYRIQEDISITPRHLGYPGIIHLSHRNCRADLLPYSCIAGPTVTTQSPIDIRSVQGTRVTLDQSRYLAENNTKPFVFKFVSAKYQPFRFWNKKMRTAIFVYWYLPIFVEIMKCLTSRKWWKNMWFEFSCFPFISIQLESRDNGSPLPQWGSRN